MSATNPAHQIPRWSVVGMEGMFVKMWDPPTESPATPDLIAPTNPVPEVMAAAGMAAAPPAPHTMQLDLLHGLTLNTWDNAVTGKKLNFFTIINPDIAATANGVYPGTTIRIPNGSIFHCSTSGKGPPPHTIHWHGMEPTPMNDGVGHCSMEIGQYTYQWQPTFIGTYFYHCHRNTMQHFEFGLFGLLLVEPADAYHATLADPTIPIGHCRDGKRRTGANLQNFPQFPGWVGGDRTDADPWTGNPALKFGTNPHAMTVPYDVEALMVFDDRDSVWSDLASDARQTFPAHGAHPGYDDNFTANIKGNANFFAFNDYNADYWFVTGVPVPCARFGTATIDPVAAGLPNGLIPPELNSGISGSMIAINAFVGQTILVRVLDAAYNNCLYTFPVDIVIIEWDGRPLGVPPYGFNEAYLVPAGTPIEVAVGRRFGALIRTTVPVNDFAVCKFIDTRGAHVAGFEQVLCTAKVPINISAQSFGITASAAANGIITPLGETRLAPGSGQTYTITPDPGYRVSALVVDGQQLPGATSHTFAGVGADHYINAYFEPSGLTITAAADANGSISPAGAVGVTLGGSQTFTITPAPGFAVSALVVDGQQLPGATSHTFTNVVASHYINAYFAPSGLTITASADANGSISPAGAIGVALGSNHTYTITPNAGFKVAALVVDGVQLPGATSHTFTNVTASHYINAYFVASDIVITAAAGLNGSISPAGATVMTQGGNQTYTITPNTGYQVSKLVVDGEQLLGAPTHTFSNVVASHYINAYFEPIAGATSFSVTASAGTGGSISPAGVTTVPTGSDLTYTITPDPGKTVVALVVDGVFLSGATSYTFTNVTHNHYINAYFQ
jgi:multicopper oxidase